MNSSHQSIDSANLKCNPSVKEIDGPFTRIFSHKVAVNKNVGIECSKIELDSHADSPVAGDNTRILERTGRTVSVSGFTDELGKPILVDVVYAALVYDCPTTGNSYVMILYNALDVSSLDCSLINPFMMRLAGIVVDKCPKFLADIPSIVHHSLYFPDQDLRIPLAFAG